MLREDEDIAHPTRTYTPTLCRKINREHSAPEPHRADPHRVRTSLLLVVVTVAPPPLQAAPPATRCAKSARLIGTARLGVAILPNTLPARIATSRANTALDRPNRRCGHRLVIVRIGVCGAGAGREKRIRCRTGVTPWPSARGAWIRARVFGSPNLTGGVVTNAVLHAARAGGVAGAEEVDGAACGVAVGPGGAEDRECVAEVVADVEP